MIQPEIQSTEEATKDEITETVEETPGQSEVRNETPEDNSQSRVNSIISRWSGSAGSFTRRASTRPHTGRRPLFRDSTRTRLVSQEMSERLLQRTGKQDSVIEDPDSSDINTNDNHESGTCVKCSFIPDHDNQVGFEGTLSLRALEQSFKVKTEFFKPRKSLMTLLNRIGGHMKSSTILMLMSTCPFITWKILMHF